KVCVAQSKENLEKNFSDGCILVLRSARADFVDYMKRASAIVSEEVGLTSESAIVAITLGIPTVVGAAHAVDTLENGEIVTVDASRGTIFRGEANAR
ncbi:MAG: PEP-utilizing enzyme, partial [Megasphaera elsdenii]|nr:PEP-utilizing enzyme [Megasphaera elsdenii]